MEYVIHGLLFACGGLWEQFVKYKLGMRGRLKGKTGFYVGVFLEIAGYGPFFVFVLWRLLLQRDVVQLASPLQVAAGALFILAGLYLNRRAVTDLKVARWNSAPLFDVATEFDSLVTTGIYSRMRHPSYSGQILLFIGCAFAIPAPHIITLAITYPVYMVLLHVRIEEYYLQQRFGQQFIEYANKTGGFVPWRLTG